MDWLYFPRYMYSLMVCHIDLDKLLQKIELTLYAINAIFAEFIQELHAKFVGV